MKKILNKSRFIAHRGLSSKYFENTILSFKAAAELPFYGIETDIHLTKDNILITHHDHFMKDYNNNIYNLSEYNYLELNEIFYEQNKNVLPLLSDYLKVCKASNKKAIIEIKPLFNLDNINKLFNEINKYKMLKESIIISFHLENLKLIIKINKNIPLQYLIGDLKDENIVNKAISDGFDIDIHHNLITKELIDNIKKSNKLINCWTVNDLKKIKKLIKLGVDYITTDGF